MSFSLGLRCFALAAVFSLACGGQAPAAGDAVPRFHDAPAAHARDAADAAPIRPAAVAGGLTFPIEVMGPGDAPVTRRVAVTATAPGTRLYLRGHSLGYDKSDYSEANGYQGKASVRVNGGTWTPISNETAEVAPLERDYGGIGGAFHTVRLTMPFEIQQGENVVEFRFNGTEGVSSGYRILDLDLRTAAGESVMQTPTAMDDPDAWTAPDGFADAASVAAGKELWQAPVPRESPLVEGPLVAACADCHAESGRDLAYYNYTNESIEVRSRFHGLTPEEGKQIAAYIRSVDLGLPEGYTAADAGRPWNPPFQPGPGLKEWPVALWPAGAGLEAVLETYDAMMPYLEAEAEKGRTDIDAAIESVEMPVAIQFPDWNEWLPDHHPYDVYGEDVWKDTRAYQEMKDLRAKLEQGRAQEIREAAGGAAERLRRGLLIEMTDAQFPTTGPPLTRRSEGGHEGLDATGPYGYTMTAHQWLGVNFWDLHTAFGLMDLGDEIYGGTPYEYRDWTWLNTQKGVWNNAPHMNGVGGTANPHYPAQGPFRDRHQNVFLSQIWYQVQVALANGPVDPNRSGTPIVSNYHFDHIAMSSEAQQRSMLPVAAHSYVALLQALSVEGDALDQTGGDRQKNNAYFRWRDIEPAKFFRPGPATYMLETAAPEVAKQSLEWMFETLLAKLERHEPSEWPRNPAEGPTTELCRGVYGSSPPGACGNFFPPKDYVPRIGDGRILEQHYADNAIIVPYKLAQYDVREDLIRRWIAWSERIWPRGDWAGVRQDVLQEQTALGE